MRAFRTILRYAFADTWADPVATTLTIALFTVILAPPALLYAAKSSLISAWTGEIARDVSNREVVISGGKASKDWITPEEIAEIRSWPETGFVAPEPSFSVRAHEWARVAGGELRPSRAAFRVLSMRTTLPGDPVLGDRQIPRGVDQVGLSHAAGEVLGAAVGDVAMVKVVRKTRGRLEREYLSLGIVAILEEAQWPAANVFVAPELARAIRAFQYHEVAREDFPAPVDMTTATWPSIRVYATSIHEAVSLRDRLRAFGFDDTRLRSDQIARLKGVETGIGGAFGLVLALGAVGFLSSVFFMEWLSAQRKTGEVGLLVILGFGTREIAAMRLVQTLILVGASVGLAILATLAAQSFFETVGAALLGLDAVNPVPIADLALGAAAALLVGVIGSIYATLRMSASDLTAAVRKD